MVTSINQTITGKKSFQNNEVSNPISNNQPINKLYADSNYLNRLTGGQIGGDLDMRGHSIKYLKFDKSDSAAARVAELNLKADSSDLNNYFKVDGSVPMSGNLNMNNNRILRLPDPKLADEPATLGYVSKLNNNLFNNYLDLKGTRKMEGNLDMNNHSITNVKSPSNENDCVNKKYTDVSIKKANILSNSILKNVFKFLMQDENEWSSEYNIKVGNFIDLAESPHSYNKRVLSITPIKDSNNYRFRLGLQMFPIANNKSYTLVVELYNRDYQTWERQQTYVNGTGLWVKSHNTQKFQHQYGSSGDLYYTKTLINFNKTALSPPCWVYYTIHFDDRGGDLNTYGQEFKNQVFIVAYGVLGDSSSVSKEVYDYHETYILKNNKMTMNVDLDMNQKSILNIGNLNRFLFIYRIIAGKSFSVNNVNLELRDIKIEIIKIFTNRTMKGKRDVLIINENLRDIHFPFTFINNMGYTYININRFFTRIYDMRLQNYTGTAFQILYNIFR